MEKTNGVIVLVYGIPAAGKTRLSTNLCKDSLKYNNGTFVSIHFDDFYPPDLRSEQIYSSARDVSDDTRSGQLFKLKDTRKHINDNIEHLIKINRLGTLGSDSPTTDHNGQLQESWIIFLHQVSASNCDVTFDDYGRYVSDHYIEIEEWGGGEFNRITR